MEPNKELEKAIANKFVTPQKFALDIEKIVVDEDLNYIPVPHPQIFSWKKIPSRDI